METRKALSSNALSTDTLSTDTLSNGTLSIDALFDIVRRLRGEPGCPWDKKQTPETMWKCLVEESYELQEALAKKDLSNTCEELGDVLFQLVFIIEIFQENQTLTLSQIVSKVAGKMIRRHPHVYADDGEVGAEAISEEALNRQWSKIKAQEKAEQGVSPVSALDRVPKGMPSLMRALSVSKCAVKEGFDWDNIHEVLDTVRDEIDEFEDALASGNAAEANLEFGDILFSLVNVARFAKIYPETALADSTAKFEKRFRHMEGLLNKRNIQLKDLPREEKDQLWEQAKNECDPASQDK